MTSKRVSAPFDLDAGGAETEDEAAGAGAIGAAQAVSKAAGAVG